MLADCGESEEEKATSEICSARDDIAKQVDELKGLTLTTATTSQVRQNLQEIGDDLSTIGDARADLSGDKRAESSWPMTPSAAQWGRSRKPSPGRPRSRTRRLS